MAQIKGINPVIVPRIPYVPIEPWDWFKENGLEDKMGGPPPMGAGPEMTPSVYIKDGKRRGNDATCTQRYHRHHRRGRPHCLL